MPCHRSRMVVQDQQHEFLPMSMPIVTTVAFDLLDAPIDGAPSQRASPQGQEHGPTIPLGLAGYHSRTLVQRQHGPCRIAESRRPHNIVSALANANHSHDLLHRKCSARSQIW